MKNQGYYMIDSSYVNAADPNTMRTFGPPRNSVYNFRPVPVEKGNSGRTESETARTNTSAKNSKRSGYDFNTIVRANDYTKNMSSSIFTPGQYTAAEKAPSVMSFHSRAKSTLTVSKKSDFSKNLTSQKKERFEKLREDIKVERKMKQELKE